MTKSDKSKYPDLFVFYSLVLLLSLLSFISILVRALLSGYQLFAQGLLLSFHKGYHDVGLIGRRLRVTAHASHCSQTTRRQGHVGNSLLWQTAGEPKQEGSHIQCKSRAHDGRHRYTTSLKILVVTTPTTSLQLETS